MVELAFNASTVAPSTGAGDVLESGIYDVIINKSEVKPTKAGNGYMLVLTMACIQPEFKGKNAVARLNINNPSSQAVEIAYAELSAISHVVGVLQWQNTQQLHGIPFKIKIDKVARSDDPSKFGNEIKGYMDMNGNPPGQHGASNGAPSAPPAPPAPPAAPPAAAQPPAAQPAAQPTPEQVAAWQAQQQAAAAPAAAPAAAAPWQQPAAAPAAAPPAAGAGAPWQQPAAAAPAAGGAPTPPWATQ